MSHARSIRWTSLRDASGFFVLALIGSELGHVLSFANGFATFWPPSGILLAGLILSHVSHWPVVLSLMLVANLISDCAWNGLPFATSLEMNLITSGECVLGTWLIRWLIGEQFRCDTLRQVAGYALLAAVLPAMLGGIIGAELVSQQLAEQNEMHCWGIWWNSHTLGAVVLGPLLFSIHSLVSQPGFYRINRSALVEAALACGVLLFCSSFAYNPDTLPYAFLAFPVLLWVALRCEVWGTCTCNLLRVGMAVWATRQGYGPFAVGYTLVEQSIMLDSFLSITGTSLLLLATATIDRRRAAEDLQESEYRFRDLLDNMGDLVQSITADGRFLYTNRAWRDTLGYDASETSSLTVFDIIHPQDLRRYRMELARLISGQSIGRSEYRFMTKSGETLVLEGVTNCRSVPGQPKITRSIYRDVTIRNEREQELSNYRRQLELANVQLHLLATTDELTRLVNRRAFHDRLREELERSHRHSVELSLILLDVDHFKSINDQFGHPAGDEVLRQISAVLRENAREFDCVARIGGEEFAVILPHTTQQFAMAIAERLRRQVTTIQGPRPVITISAGLATYSPRNPPPDENTERLLIHAADNALYSSKQHGRNRVTPAVPLPELSLTEPVEESPANFRVCVNYEVTAT